MKLTIVGDGSFGRFLKELLAPHFELCDSAQSIILAVPASSYNACGRFYGSNLNNHLINVCSVQKPTTDTLLTYTDRVTSIHPLFGRRTPSDKRNSIITYKFSTDNDTWLSQSDIESEFLDGFSKVSKLIQHDSSRCQNAKFTPETHDVLMAKTHASALMAAKQLKVFTDRAKDIPDELIPNSFRLMREFVKCLDDMPAGTVESIMANPYI